MPISISMIVLGSQLVMPVADGVPKFDIARSCKLDVAATAGLLELFIDETERRTWFLFEASRQEGSNEA